MYFPVSFNNEERLMRFGLVKYSENGDYNKVQLSLVHKVTDEELSKPFINNSKVNIISDYVSRLKLINENLINILVKNNLLSEEDKSEILELSDKDVFIKRVELNKVSDIYKYAL